MDKDTEEKKQDVKDVGIMVETYLLILLQEHFVSKAEVARHAAQALCFKEERLHSLKFKMDNILTELFHLM